MKRRIDTSVVRREGKFVATKDAWQEWVIYASRPTWRDLWAIIRGRYTPELIVFHDRVVEDEHPDAILFDYREGKRERINDILYGLKPTVSDEVHAAYREDWEKRGRPEPKLMLERSMLDDGVKPLRNGGIGPLVHGNTTLTKEDKNVR
jgi:hypothetical protein